MASVQHDPLLSEEVMHDHSESDLGAILDSRYLNTTSNLSDLNNVATARTNLGLIAGGTGDIWVEKAGDTMTGALTNTLATGNSLVWDTDTLVVNATGHSVGIGTASPTAGYKLDVSGAIYSQGLSVGNDGYTAGHPVFFQRTTTDITASNYGIYNQLGVNASGNSSQRYYGMTNIVTAVGDKNNAYLAGVEFATTNGGTGTITDAYGVQGGIGVTQAGGVITNAYGAYTYGYSTTGTVTNLYGMYVASPSGGGTFTTAYGLYIANQTGATNNYGAYIGGTTQINLPTAATATVNSVLISRWTRPQTPAVKYGNAMDILIGSYGTDVASQTRVDFKLADVYTDLPDTTVLTLQGNGNVGIGTTAPGALLDVRGSAIFNEAAADADFRIEGQTDANLFFLDASIDRVGVGTASPAVKFDVNGDTKTLRLGVGASPSYTFHVQPADLTPADANTVGAYYVFGVDPSVNQSSSATASALYFAMYGKGTHNIGIMRGLNGIVWHQGSGTVDSVAGLYAAVLQSTGTINSASGLRIQATNVFGGTLVNNYGIYLENQVGGSNNYAIFTNAGLNEFNDQLFLDGSADRVQLRVQAHSTQTTNLVTFENSSGTVLGGVNGTGHAGFGTAPSTSYGVNINKTTSDTGAYGANIEARINTTTNYGSRSSALDMQCQYFGSNNLTASYSGSGYSWGGLIGFYGGTLHSGTGTVDTIIATSGQNLLRSGAVATNVFGLYSNPVFVDVGTATITNAFGLYVKNPFNTSGTITNFYGIYLPSLDKATNNYAILTNAGNIVFNEGGDASTDFRVESDTEANMLFVDANADTDGALYLGGTTNGIKVNKGGVLTFLGTANISGGATGTFTTADAKTVTVIGGIITSIV